MAQHATGTNAKQTPEEAESGLGFGKIGIGLWLSLTLLMLLNGFGDFSIVGYLVYGVFALALNYYIVLMGRGVLEKLHIL